MIAPTGAGCKRPDRFAPGNPPIHTSRQERERALPIMQALLTALEARTFEVNATAEGVRVTILDESIGFAIEEETKKVEHAVTFTEQKLIDRGLAWQVPKHDVVPSGFLSLVITNGEARSTAVH